MSSVIDSRTVAEETLEVIAAARVASERLEEIALLQETCPLAARIAVEGLREMRALIAPEAEPVAFRGSPMDRVGALDLEIAGEQAFDRELRQR
jgi:hypothetical protein